MGKTIRIPDEIRANIINDYINGMSGEACARKYNIYGTTVMNILKKNNVEIRKNIPRKYSYNENYFNVIDTEEKAYWLGFIAADGSIGKEGKTLEIGLSSVDEDHLIKFAKCIGAETNIVKRKKSKCNDKLCDVSRVYIANKQIAQDLIKAGLDVRKSLTLEYPKNIPSHLQRHFIRGYFDGDGWITKGDISPYGIQRYIVGIIATKPFLDEMIKILEKEGIYPTNPRKNGKMYIWSTSGMDNIIKFIDFIYKDSNVYLQRKYEKSLEYCRLISKLQER